MATVIDIGEKLGKQLAEQRVTTSQLRKFLSAVNVLSNKIQSYEEEELSEDLVNEIQYLRVKLAYQAGREKKSNGGLHYLQSNIDVIIKNIGNSKKKFNEFANLMESIIAYHKFNGGQD